VLLPPPPPPPTAPPPPAGSVPPEGYVPVGWNGVPRPPHVDGMAIAALLCGAGGLMCLLAPILGIVFGFIARSRICKANGELTGAGLAVAGIVVSSLMAAVSVTFLVLGQLLS
jgi:hypothetical protein